LGLRKRVSAHQPKGNNILLESQDSKRKRGERKIEDGYKGGFWFKKKMLKQQHRMGDKDKQKMKVKIKDEK